MKKIFIISFFLLITFPSYSAVKSKIINNLQNIKNVSFEYVDPITINFDKHALVELPPNGQGVTAFLIKKMLDRLKISNFDPLWQTKVIIQLSIKSKAYESELQAKVNSFRCNPYLRYFSADHH